jgi:hypothetical protein
LIKLFQRLCAADANAMLEHLKCYVQNKAKTPPRILDYPRDPKLEGISVEPDSGEKQALMLSFGMAMR